MPPEAKDVLVLMREMAGWINKQLNKKMAKAFENVRNSVVQNLQSDNTTNDKSELLYHLEERQKRALDLFLKQKIITTKDLALLMGIGIRAANNICNRWFESGFIEASSAAKKNRGYFLGKKWTKLIK